MYLTDLSPETGLRTRQLLEAVWYAIDSPVGVPQSKDATQQSLLYAEALARQLGLIPPLGSGMADVTTSIGTTGRDYSTITAWEADLDNGGLYSASDNAIGECYDDSAFDESVVINGGGTVGLASIRLTVASGERHDGTAGTGSRIVRSSISSRTVDINNATIPITVEWLEIDHGGNTFNGDAQACQVQSSTAVHTVQRLIAHGFDTTSGNTSVLMANTGDVDFQNNIVYDASQSAGGGAYLYGIYAFGLAGCVASIQNNTVYGITRNTGTGPGYGIGTSSDDASKVIRNNISVDTGGTGSGTIADYTPTSFSNATVSHNLSSDSTASGTGSLTNKSSSNQFVSTTGGSEDLHLKSGADAIDAGTDLGTTPSGVSVDIDGRDRDAEADTWDMGADEFVAVGGGGLSIPIAMYHYKRLMGVN